MAKSLRKRQAKLNARRNDHAATLKSVKDPAAYKQPGSMKKGKLMIDNTELEKLRFENRAMRKAFEAIISLADLMARGQCLQPRETGRWLKIIARVGMAGRELER